MVKAVVLGAAGEDLFSIIYIYVYIHREVFVIRGFLINVGRWGNAGFFDGDNERVLDGDWLTDWIFFAKS